MHLSLSGSRVRRAAALGVVLGASALAASTPASAGVALSTSGWEWSDPLPQGYSLSALSFAGDTGYAVGAGGTALLTKDGGQSFTGLFTGTSLSIDRVDLSSTGLALGTANRSGAKCSLLASRDGGTTFNRVLIGTSDTSCSGNQITAFDFVTGDLGYIMREGGAVLKTTDAGQSIANASTVDGGVALAFVSDTKGFAIGSAGIYQTIDGAQTWSLARSGAGLRSIAAYGSDTLIAWGNGQFVRSTDGGTTWNELPGLTGDPAAISVFGANRIAYVIGGKLIISEDGGATSRTVTVGNGDIRAASYVSETRIVAVGSAGATYVSTDGGATFARTSSEPITTQIPRVVGTSGGPVGLGTGRIGRLVDGRWQVRATLSGGFVQGADFSSAQDGYVLHADGSLVRTANNGLTWSRVDAGTPSAAQRVMTPSADSVLLIGKFGAYRASGGGSFSKVSGGPNGRGRWVADHSGARIAYATTTGKRANLQFVFSANAGKSWRKVTWPKSLPAPINNVTVLPGGGMLVSAGQRLFRTGSDSAKKWTEVLLGSDMSAVGKVYAATGNELYADAGNGWNGPVVLHSSNGGKTWQPQAVGAADSYIAWIATDGAKRAFVVSFANGGGNNASGSGIFQTTTGGERGTASTLSLSRTASKLKRVSGSTVQIRGQLAGAKGGEQVRVAIRRKGQVSWRTTIVTVGVNGGGSFTANFSAAKGSYVVMAGWTGDSGRAGTMTAPKAITVR